MSGITSVLDIAARSLSIEQLGVEVSSNNISNVNTPGYSRQILYLETAYPVNSAYGPLGRGAQVQGIGRAFDPFVTARLDEKTGTLAEYKTNLDTLNQLCAFFNETQDGGLSSQLAAFWGAWNDLANNPAGSGERQALLQQSLNLSEAFSSRADQLIQERSNLTQQIGPTLKEINDLSAQIAHLSQEITESESDNQKANDLRDQQQQAINRLSELAGVRYYTGGDGSINVTLPNGLPLVQGIESFSLDYQITADDKVAVLWQGPGGVTQDTTAGLDGGQLTALVKGRDEIIPRYQDSLDQLARDLIVTINGQHSQGVGLQLFSTVTGTYAVNAPTDPLNAAGLPFGDRLTAGTFQIHVDRDGVHLATSTINVAPGMSLNDLVNTINTDPNIGGLVTASVDGGCLKITANQPTDSFGFGNDTSNLLLSLGVNTLFTGDKAYTLNVNPLVLANQNYLAAGQIDPATGAHAPGDNRNALAVADLENAPVNSMGQTLSDVLTQMITDLGLETEQTGSNKQFFQSLVEQLTQMRNAVSGVSLDEEMTNLIKYQRAYQAAARLVTVAEEMYETLLTLKQ